MLSRTQYCKYSETLTVSIHKSLHLNLTFFIHWFDKGFDSIIVKSGENNFGPYTEAMDSCSLFIKHFTAEISYKVSMGRVGNRQAFEFTYQPSIIGGLNSYQLHPFEYVLAYMEWSIATFRVVTHRIDRIRLHLTNLSCKLLRELIVFDGPGLMSEIVKAYKFNTSNNTNVNCANYTILATTFQVYIAWMSKESPDVLGSINYENSQPTHRIDIDGEHHSRIHFVKNGASLPDVTAWQYVYNIKCAINRRVQLNMHKVRRKGLSDSQCHYGGMAVCNIDDNDLKLVALWCESISHLEKYHGILNLTSTENRFSIVLYGYRVYFEIEIQFDVSFTECVGLFFCLAPRTPAYVQYIREYEGSISIRINVPCKDCIVLQFLCLPFETIATIIEYTMIWESSRCTKDGAALVNITDFPSHTFFGHYPFRGVFFALSDSYTADLTQAQVIGSSLETMIPIEVGDRRRIQLAHFKNHPCPVPCKYLQLNSHVLDSLEANGQTHFDLCNNYLVTEETQLQPTYNTCMEIRTKGINCEDVKSNLEIMFSGYYTVQVSFNGNIDLYLNDMYTRFYIYLKEAHDTHCLTFVKFSNSLVEPRTLYFEKQFVYGRGRLASYTGFWKTWREIEHFCVAQGQQMVTVNNVEEQSGLMQFAKEYLLQGGVPLGISRDVGISLKGVKYNDKDNLCLI